MQRMLSSVILYGVRNYKYSKVQLAELAGIPYRSGSINKNKMHNARLMLSTAQRLVPVLFPNCSLEIVPDDVDNTNAIHLGESVSMTSFLRAVILETTGYRELSRKSGVSLGAIYNLKNNQDSEIGLDNVQKLVPVLFEGYSLAIKPVI